MHAASASQTDERCTMASPQSVEYCDEEEDIWYDACEDIEVDEWQGRTRNLATIMRSCRLPFGLLHLGQEWFLHGLCTFSCF